MRHGIDTLALHRLAQLIFEHRPARRHRRRQMPAAGEGEMEIGQRAAMSPAAGPRRRPTRHVESFEHQRDVAGDAGRQAPRQSPSAGRRRPRWRSACTRISGMTMISSERPNIVRGSTRLIQRAGGCRAPPNFGVGLLRRFGTGRGRRFATAATSGSSIRLEDIAGAAHGLQIARECAGRARSCGAAGSSAHRHCAHCR